MSNLADQLDALDIKMGRTDAEKAASQAVVDAFFAACDADDKGRE